MLDREVVEEFLDWELAELDLAVPPDVPMEALVEAFCRFIEDSYDEWLRSNFRTFFNHGNPDWEWIRERLATNEEQ
jgi:hypothetical protein